MGQFDLLITNGDVVLEDGVQRLDIGVRDGRIAALDPALAAEARETIDAAGKLVFPGFIDAHTHMGIPILDTTSADDFASGSIAAAFGGVTTVLDFTVQEPGQTLREALDIRRSKAEGHSYVDFGFHLNITDRPLERLGEIPALIADGFTSFKVFSTYRQAGMMIGWDEFEAVMRQVAAHGGLLMLHAEDNDIVESCTAEHLAGDLRHPRYHARCRPAEAEAKAVERAGEIAAALDAPLYIVHLSSQAGLEAGLRARAEGAPLYLETCPQYLVLTEEAYERENGHWFITTPPLRSEADAEALWGALAADQIDVVGTDHCPFTTAQKASGGMVFHLTPNGLPGVETLFPLLYTYGVAAGRISLPQLVRLLASNPARIFGIDHRKGAVRPGADADLVIWDPTVETILRAEQLHGNADCSPYEGLPVVGSVESVILRGQFLVREGHFVGQQVQGELLLSRTTERAVR